MPHVAGQHATCCLFPASCEAQSSEVPFLYPRDPWSPQPCRHKILPRYFSPEGNLGTPFRSLVSPENKQDVDWPCKGYISWEPTSQHLTCGIPAKNYPASCSNLGKWLVSGQLPARRLTAVPLLRCAVRRKERLIRAFPSARELNGEELLQENWEKNEGVAEATTNTPGQRAPSNRVGPPHQQLPLFDHALAWMELACLVGSVVRVAVVTLRGWLTSGTFQVAASAFSGWPSAALLLALIINAALRIRGSRPAKGEGGWESAGLEVAAARDRMGQLEEDVGTTVKMVRVLSRQLEKLGVRFRVSRRTLQDPIRETAALVEHTSQAVAVLAARAERAESELQETQLLLLAMQDQAARQLQLFASAMTQAQRAQRELERKVAALERGSLGGDSSPGPSPAHPASRSGKPTGAQPSTAGKSAPGSTLNGTAGKAPWGRAPADRQGQPDNGLVQRLGALGWGILAKGEETMRETQRTMGGQSKERAREAGGGRKERGGAERGAKVLVPSSYTSDASGKGKAGKEVECGGAPEGGVVQTAVGIGGEAQEWLESQSFDSMPSLAKVDFWADDDQGSRNPRGQGRSSDLVRDEVVEGVYQERAGEEDGTGAGTGAAAGVGLNGKLNGQHGSLRAWFRERQRRNSKRLASKANGEEGNTSQDPLKALEKYGEDN